MLGSAEKDKHVVGTALVGCILALGLWLAIATGFGVALVSQLGYRLFCFGVVCCGFAAITFRSQNNQDFQVTGMPAFFGLLRRFFDGLGHP